MNTFPPVMDLPGIFTKTNLRILSLLRKEKLHIREIADRLGCSPAKVHGCISTFKGHGLIEERWEKNKKIIILNKKSALLGAIESVMGADQKKQADNSKDSISIFDAIS